MRIVASIRGNWVLGCLLVMGLTAHADTRPLVSARALRPAGRELVKAGLGRIAPAVLAHLRAGLEAQPSLQAALTSGLDGLGIPGLAAAYGGHFVLVGKDGLSPAGEALVAFLGTARFHGVDVSLPEVAKGLGAPVHAAAPPIPEGALEAAWSESAGTTEGAARLDAAAQALAAKLPTSTTPVGLTSEARVAAEVALAGALAALVAELPARPRMEAVLEDAEGYYLSPDTVWKHALPVKAGAEAVVEALEAARSGALAEHLAALAPVHPQYRGLVQAAERYAAICAAGEWTPLGAVVSPAAAVAGPVLKNPKAAFAPEAVTALQTRLAREGFFSGPATGVWDPSTSAAVLEVRRTRHLKDKEPLFDKDLVRVLDVPCAERLATLLLNVKRWRHSAWSGETESVQVNLAGQMLRYYRDGALVMSQRTIVGSDKSFFSKSLGRRYWRNATPILHDTIATVIVNPEWNVPGRIAREELQPEIDKDPTYIERNRFKVRVGGDGATYYVQESGPGNALGRIKILFPNSESVYLHDTPGRAAFNLPVRALSHGCVRVQNAVDFGAELVRSDKAKSGEVFDVATIKAIVAGTARMRIFELAHEIPVFLEYYTASVDESGAVWFHPDVYGYDQELFHPELALQP